jgi:hypothetical protein
MSQPFALRPVVHASPRPGAPIHAFSACGIPSAAAPVGARRSTLDAAATCPSCLALLAGEDSTDRYAAIPFAPVRWCGRVVAGFVAVNGGLGGPDRNRRAYTASVAGFVIRTPNRRGRPTGSR